METYTLLYVKQIASGNLPCDRELNPVLCDNLEGQDGREVQEGRNICIPVAEPAQYCKAISLQ